MIGAHDSKPPQALIELDPELELTWPTTVSIEQVRELLTKAINTQQLLKAATAIESLPNEIASPAIKEEASRGVAACRNISHQLQQEEAEILEQLHAAGIESHSCQEAGDIDSRQIHTSAIFIDANRLIEAISIAGRQGFNLWTPKTKAALECVRRSRSSEILIKQNEATIRLELRWKDRETDPASRSRLHPSEADFDLISLPRSFWPLYYLIRPFRIAHAKLFGKSPPPPPWVYLGTPGSLIPPLLELAKLTKNDLLVDLGCGDGRILIDATERYGCRGLGIEIDEDLYRLAREKISDGSLQDKIRIECRDVSEVSLQDATVVFVFLPVRTLVPLLDKLREQLPSGARVIAHEQDPIDPDLKPNQSIPIFTSTAITVAHVWIID